jgi:hypothetical protein
MTVHWNLGQFHRSAAVRILLLTAACWLCAPPAVHAQGVGAPPTLPPELEQVCAALDKYQDPLVAVVWLNKSADFTPLKLLRVGVYCTARYGHCFHPQERR